MVVHAHFAQSVKLEKALAEQPHSVDRQKKEYRLHDPTIILHLVCFRELMSSKREVQMQNDMFRCGELNPGLAGSGNPLLEY